MDVVTKEFLEQNISKRYPDIFIDDLYEYAFMVSLNNETINKLKNISMLHYDTLVLLNLFGKLSKKGILDLGAYVGGSTIAMALNTSVPIIAVEPGGDFVNQPSIPSKNIIDDFINNIVEWNTDKKITLVRGKSYDDITIKRIKHKIKEIDLILLDNDGDVKRDLNLYSEILVNKCIVVIDDYVSADNKSKEVRKAVDELVEQKILEPFGVFMWGTWFGKYLKP